MFALKDYGFDIMHGQKSLVTPHGLENRGFPSQLADFGIFVLIGRLLLTQRTALVTGVARVDGSPIWDFSGMAGAVRGGR